MTASIAILGAGLSGNLLALMLARRGLDVTVVERQPAPEDAVAPAGRSINLALASRGIHALGHAGALADIEPLLLPMPGRRVHDTDGSVRFLPYGQRAEERIWSVSRHELNRCLIAIAREHTNVSYEFDSDCIDFDPETLIATIRSPNGDRTVRADLLVAADGAGSIVRRRLQAAGEVTATERLLDHGYKELTIPPSTDGEFALDPEGLHIWPRGGFMLIALPNRDRTFTATLFLPHQGEPGFDTITSANVASFFEREFADAHALMPELESEFAARPVGSLGTIDCAPWQLTRPAPVSRTVLLIGDAAHAIVPFHGQGMNAAFEDCVAFDQLIEKRGPDWQRVTEAFEAGRRDNTRAIAGMAIENYEEMRDTVREPEFERRAKLSFALEQRFPGRFIPRYSMVMFHPEIEYAEAERRGAIQAEILDEALRLEDEDSALELAANLVNERLPSGREVQGDQS